jgi:vancomycin resistance protein YoaR
MYPRARRGGLIALAVLAGAAALLVGGWAVDAGIHSGQVMRNVSLAGRPVGGLSETDLRAVVASMAEARVAVPVEVVTPAGSYELTAAQLGLEVDREATVAAVLAAGRDGPSAGRPLQWAGRLLAGQDVALRYSVDRVLAEAALAPVVAANRTDPVEPTLLLADGVLAPVGGTPGATLDLEDLDGVLVRAADGGGDRLRVELGTVPLPPAHSDDEIREVARRAEALASRPLTVVVAGEATRFEPDTLRRWMRAAPGPGGGPLEVQVDLPSVEADLAARVGNLGTPPVDLRWEVGPAGVTFIEGRPGTRCCAPDSPARVIEALTTGRDQVTLDLTPAPPPHDAAWARRMGIVEPVASFTTSHACCEARVRNIHRIADLVRGVVIEPGETFSLNGTVGPRTPEKGFVQAGVIYNGRFQNDYGGGVSQFATTLFNAAFFAGLDIPEFQAHTIYISRYPYGREATLSYPSPDLKITNNTPYGVLLWPTYTDTSITVTLYSTKTIEAAQTGQTTSPAGRCTRVRTERTRTWIGDGRSEVDTFGALYQPAEGVLC